MSGWRSERATRGRPRKGRHLDDFADAGEPPRDDVLAIGHWLQRIVAITAHQAREHRGAVKVREGIRSSCTAAARLLPSALTAVALGLDDFDDVDPAGPPPRDPLRVSVWFLLNLVEDVRRQITDTADDKVSAEWRSASRAAVKVLPPDLLVEARRLLRDELGGSDTADSVETERFGATEIETAGGERPRSLNLIS